MSVDKQDWEEYMKQLKENEAKRASFNERQRRWQAYLDTKQPKRSETSFDMNKY